LLHPEANALLRAAGSYVDLLPEDITQFVWVTHRTETYPHLSQLRRRRPL